MFSEIPFLKLFMALALGIFSSVFLALNTNSIALIGAFFTLLLVQQLSLKHSRLIPAFGLSLYIFIFFTGVFIADKETNKATKNQFKQESFVIGEILKTPKVYDKFIKTNLKIIALKNKGSYKESTGKSLLMIEKDSLALQLTKGDVIRFVPQFKEIKSNNNPETFNYKRYLFFHLISQQSYLKSNTWKKINYSEHKFSPPNISRLRDYLIRQYKKYGIKNDELSVLSALTLGYKNDLDKNIQKSYASSGAIHVLAVSGLHVGIVFVIISQILKFLGKERWAKIVRFVLSILFIWFFAFLTGAAPSVLRASVMFSFIALGQALNRSGTIYNSIFSSAFIMLLINPFLLFDLSFQLSYSAVISIVYFQAKISSLLHPQNKFMKWTWDLVSVSIAAQIGTVPIIIYYFHQFPNYFLISNFIVIPMATIIIWLSLIFFLSLKVTFVASFLAKTILLFISIQNHLIQKIGMLPYALTKDLFIDTPQLILLILIVLSLILVSYKSNFRNSLIFGLTLLIFINYSNYKSIEQGHQKKIIVYDINQQTAINLIDGNDNILISSLKENTKLIDYNIKNNWLSLGLETEKYIKTRNLNSSFALSNIFSSSNPNFFSKNQFIQFYDKRILYLQSKEQIEELKPSKIKLDYIIIGKNTMVDVAELKLHFDFKQIIIDSSHSIRNLQFWKTQSVINPSEQIYIVAKDGAFINNFNPKRAANTI